MVQPRMPVLIAVEGLATERAYFESLRKDSQISERFAVTVHPAGGGSARTIVDAAVKRLNRQVFEKCWCVLDVESEEQRNEQIIKDALQLAKEHSIELIWSNPCFERWYLCHFENSAGHFINCSALQNQLKKHWKDRFKQDYEKSDERTCDRLQPLTSTAVENARRSLGSQNILKTNSATEVFRLVDYLLNGR